MSADRADHNASDPLTMARAFGLHRLAEHYPEEVAEAADFARTLTERLPGGLSPEDEPAHVYRASRKQPS